MYNINTLSIYILLCIDLFKSFYYNNSGNTNKQNVITKVKFYNITDDTEVDADIRTTAEWYFKNNFDDNSAFIAYLSLVKGSTFRIDSLKVYDDGSYGCMQISSYALNNPIYGVLHADVNDKWVWK